MIVYDIMGEGGVQMVYGRLTGCDLGNLTPLFMPWREMDGLLRPDISQPALQLSLELAATAYDLKVDPWRDAGWRDFSYQVDNTLLTGPAVNGKGFAGAFGDYFRYLAQARIKRNNPISQIRGALRQREGSDTCKSLVMIHKALGNQYVVAIGFMGTGRRIYDWFSNFRMEAEEGMHKGFLQLARQFEENIEKIQFPETAKELGLERLTLSDILDRCRRPGSPFRIWLAGHSQGGAVMQLIAFREIRKGLLRQNLTGYGFASPSVVYENPGCDLSGFPLYHIINGDDLTPRIGAALHIGRCLVYQPDHAMRAFCYRAGWKEETFRKLLRQLQIIRDNRTALIWTIALLHALKNVPDAESVAVISGVFGRMPERFQGILGGRMDGILQYLIQKTENAYMLHTGELNAPAGAVLMLRLRIEQMLYQCGAKEYVRLMLQALSLPHKIRGVSSENGMAAYQYIVNRHYEALRQRIWCGSAPYGLPSRGRAPDRKKRRSGGRFARLTMARQRHMR